MYALSAIYFTKYISELYYLKTKLVLRHRYFSLPTLHFNVCKYVCECSPCLRICNNKV